jgi:hypothetical protein
LKPLLLHAGSPEADQGCLSPENAAGAVPEGIDTVPDFRDQT